MGGRTLHRPALRVRVYEQIAEAIRTGTFPVGSQLPTEPELCEGLGVSRTALREALVLLEEDGLLRMHRGVGRFVTSDRARVGPKRLRVVEDLLADEGGPVTVTRTQVEVETPAHLTRTGLDVSERDELRFWESTLQLDGEPAALTMEWSVPDETLAEVYPRLPEWLAAAESSSCTMLGRLMALPELEPVHCTATISATVLGQERADILGTAADVAMLQLRQVVADDTGQPLVLAKVLLAPCAPPLTLAQIS